MLDLPLFHRLLSLCLPLLTLKEFFDQSRIEIGKRSSDATRAKFISKEIEKIIDEIYPPFRGVMAARFKKDSTILKKRDEALKTINDILLSGEPKIINKPVLNEAGEELFKQAKKETPNLTKDDFIKQLDVGSRRQFSTIKQTADSEIRRRTQERNQTI